MSPSNFCGAQKQLLKFSQFIHLKCCKGNEINGTFLNLRCGTSFFLFSLWLITLSSSLWSQKPLHSTVTAERWERLNQYWLHFHWKCGTSGAEETMTTAQFHWLSEPLLKIRFFSLFCGWASPQKRDFCRIPFSFYAVKKLKGTVC